MPITVSKENHKADELLRDANHLLETCFWACMNERRRRVGIGWTHDQRGARQDRGRSRTD